MHLHFPRDSRLMGSWFDRCPLPKLSERVKREVGCKSPADAPP